MRIPERNVENFFAETVAVCTADQLKRKLRGSALRNLYLTGDESGQPAVYNKTFDSIEDLAAYTCSSTDLRYLVSYPRGGSVVQRAMASAAGHELLEQSRATGLDTMIEEAAIWSYVLGKTFIKMLWSSDGLEPHLIMPEMMGVWHPGLTDLDSQEAFTHSLYITPDQLKLQLRNHPDAVKVYRKIMQQQSAGRGDSPDQNQNSKQVILGGYQPYTGAGGIKGAQYMKGSGIAQWQDNTPEYSPQMVATLVRLDELWVKDDENADDEGKRDYTTMLGVGNVLISGKDYRMNTFSTAFDPANKAVMRKDFEDNPLAYKHPFIEFFPNRLQGNFWGRSELNNTALLQVALNNRINGINKLLRRQEDPPVYFIGGASKTDEKVAKLTKPGGYLHDPDPTAKPPTVLAPDLPQGLYESVAQNERWFDVMTGMTPTLQGMASPSVRSHGQTGQLTTNATPRFKKKAIRLERSVQEAAALLFCLLKAKSTDLLTGWVMPAPDMPEELLAKLVDPSVEPPAPGMKAIQFYLYEMPANVKVTVDGHSGSPAFGDESTEKAILLRKANAMSTSSFIDAINPPDADGLIAEANAAEIAKALEMKQQQAQQQNQPAKPASKK